MAKRRGHRSLVVKCVSAQSGLNVDEYLDELLQFHEEELASGRLNETRRKQKLNALHQILQENVLEHFRASSNDIRSHAEKLIMSDSISVSKAAQLVLDNYVEKFGN